MTAYIPLTRTYRSAHTQKHRSRLSQRGAAAAAAVAAALQQTAERVKKTDFVTYIIADGRSERAEQM